MPAVKRQAVGVASEHQIISERVVRQDIAGDGKVCLHLSRRGPLAQLVEHLTFKGEIK